MLSARGMTLCDMSYMYPWFSKYRATTAAEYKVFI